VDLGMVIYILSGSTFGLILRLLIKYKLRRRKETAINKSLIVNVLSSFFLGILIALNLTNKNLLLFFLVGFLGSLSTFSSFIYELFSLIRKRNYLSLMIYYIEVLGLSFICFYIGYFIILNFKN